MRFTAIVFVLVAVLALASAEEGIFKVSEYQNCTSPNLPLHPTFGVLYLLSGAFLCSDFTCVMSLI